jgi:MYND finger
LLTSRRAAISADTAPSVDVHWNPRCRLMEIDSEMASRVADALADTKELRNLWKRLESDEPCLVIMDGAPSTLRKASDWIRIVGSQNIEAQVAITSDHRYIPFLFVEEDESCGVVYEDDLGNLCVVMKADVGIDEMQHVIGVHSKKHRLAPCVCCALPSSVHRKCGACWRNGRNRTVYCSKACQTRHWSTHRESCGLL